MSPAISYVPLEQMDERTKAAGTAASMAPGFETAEDLAASKTDPGYWASSHV